MTQLAPPKPQPSWAYFFDIDGTLSELAATPERARLAPALRDRLAALRTLCGGAVAVVSGRPLRDIDAIFDGMLLPAAGQHGAERRDPAGQVSHLPADRARLDEAHAVLARLVARHPGLLLEDKGHSLALHYRAAPRAAGFSHRSMRALQRRLGAGFTVQGGKRLVELVPSGIDKGRAIRAFLMEPPFVGRLPVFLGDDVSDEPAFATVDALDGHSVKVGPGPSAARWRLASVTAVREWLPAPRHAAPAGGAVE
ncbi:MAG: trehalose-phosphatase [Gemmatimonadaceae bacterium]